jgi:hypothetical protein
MPNLERGFARKCALWRSLARWLGIFRSMP